MTKQIERRLDALEQDQAPYTSFAEMLRISLDRIKDRRAQGITQEQDHAELIRRLNAGELRSGSLIESMARSIQKRMN